MLVVLAARTPAVTTSGRAVRPLFDLTDSAAATRASGIRATGCLEPEDVNRQEDLFG
jgi:hypothetical protein